MDALPRLSPMLASSAPLPDSTQWACEPRLDGWRVLLYVEGDIDFADAFGPRGRLPDVERESGQTYTEKRTSIAGGGERGGPDTAERHTAPSLAALAEAKPPSGASGAAPPQVARSSRPTRVMRSATAMVPARWYAMARSTLAIGKSRTGRCARACDRRSAATAARGAMAI